MFNPGIKKHIAGMLALFGMVCSLSWNAAFAQATAAEQIGATTAEAVVETIEEKTAFGNWIFGGEFANQSFVGFNPDYAIAVGDKVSLKLWGGFEFTGELTVDPQGNIFVPKVGPVPVRGVLNSDLNTFVRQSVKRIFKANVGVYASLGGAEPVKVFVTGFVRKPGLFAGHSSDSVLYFLDQAGGIDSARGSFLDVKVLRGGQEYRSVNLYDFILNGALPIFQLRDGDTIIVPQVSSQIGVFGVVKNENLFEFKGPSIIVSDLLEMAAVQPHATHVRISRNNRSKSEVEYVSLAAARTMEVFAGDVLHLTSDKNKGSISVRVEGEHNSAQEFILRYGATLGDLLAQVEYGENAQISAIMLMRESVRLRQKEMLHAQLRALESSVLNARSNTVNEADLRQREADLILRWVARAEKIEPLGQVSLAGSTIRNDILLESGDIIRIPRISNLVMVHGDVLFPSAMAFQPGVTIAGYIEKSGGFIQSKNKSNVLILHRDGTFRKVKKGDLDSRKVTMKAGDEIFVLPRVATKHIQIASDIISIFYQLALSAAVVLRL